MNSFLIVTSVNTDGLKGRVSCSDCIMTCDSFFLAFLGFSELAEVILKIVA